jgi:outer membrane protein TolC
MCILLGAAIALSGSSSAVFAQQPAAPASAPLRLTLEDVKQRALANNKLLQLAAHNVQSKDFATRAVRANYFPQVIGASVYFHFDDALGNVLTTPGRKVTGPLGQRTFLNIPATTLDVPLFNQDSQFSTITFLQPITDLLKVRQGVKIAQADYEIADAQRAKGEREVASGVEQLFWGLLAAQRIEAGILAAAGPTAELAKTGNLEARLALVEGQQALGQVSSQIADLREQLLILLDLPTCSAIELVEPPLPVAPVGCADEAVAQALASSPEIREAEATVGKAHAAVAAGKLDYLPSIALTGGYANNTMLTVVQQNIGYLGVVGTYTFVDWGKRRNTIRERDELVCMATLKLQQTQDDVRQKALKAFRDYQDTAAAVKLANELAGLRAEAFKAAADPAAKFKTGKDLMTSQVDAVKADLNHRIAFVKLGAILGKE